MEKSEMMGRAVALGMDHAEDEHHGKRKRRLYSGRDIARELGLSGDMEGQIYVGLRDAYAAGWSDFW